MSPARRLLRAGLTTGVSDGFFAILLGMAYYGSPGRPFRGVAATLLGPGALDGGWRTTLIGVAMHFGVAFAWSAIFLLLFMASGWLRRTIESPPGIFAVASVYGPAIWLVMSCLVIPMLVHRPPAITFRWWIQLVGHIPFVGIPIVTSTRDRTTHD